MKGFDRRKILGGVAASATLPLLPAISSKAEAATGQPLTRIAFGSCCHQDKEQPIWANVNRFAPDLFIFLGDNIYGDTEDMAVMRGKYSKLAAKPGFQELRKKAKVIATWDDHDYGVNDGGFEYPKKKESREVFLDFWQVPKEHPRRSHDGIYGAYYYGRPGKRVQVILPDNRTFRSPLLGMSVEPEDKGNYLINPDPDATMLGRIQWDWLEHELRQPADIRIFASSTQVLADAPGYEAWVNYQADYQRLIDVIDFTQADGLFMISGDTHYAELSKRTDAVPYPLYDLTSSGLTEVWKFLAPNKNRIAQAPLMQNFGRISIDWNGMNPAITMEVETIDGAIAISQNVKLSELRQAKR
jgi:alkaline phosphatase D